jgi:O-antigen ligase
MLAAFLILTLPIVLLSIPKKFAKTKLSLGLLAVATIFITFSRSGLILMVIQSSIIFRRFWKLLLILIVLTTPLIFVRLASIFTFDTLAVLRREQLSDYAIRIFLENPFAGVGLNNFINVLAFDEVLVGTSRFLQPVHNVFLLILSETGLLGLLGTLALILPAFWNNLSRIDSLSRVLLGNLLMIIFLGLFDHYFLTLPQGQRLLFLILGLSFRKV